MNTMTAAIAHLEYCIAHAASRLHAQCERVHHEAQTLLDTLCTHALNGRRELAARVQTCAAKLDDAALLCKTNISELRMLVAMLRRTGPCADMPALQMLTVPRVCMSCEQPVPVNIHDLPVAWRVCEAADAAASRVKPLHAYEFGQRRAFRVVLRDANGRLLRELDTRALACTCASIHSIEHTGAATFTLVCIAKEPICTCTLSYHGIELAEFAFWCAPSIVGKVDSAPLAIVSVDVRTSALAVQRNGQYIVQKDANTGAVMVFNMQGDVAVQETVIKDARGKQRSYVYDSLLFTRNDTILMMNANDILSEITVTGTVLRQFPNLKEISHMALHGDVLLASAGFEQYFFDLSSSKIRFVDKRNYSCGDYVSGVAFSGDGSLYILMSANYIRVFDTRSKRLRTKFSQRLPSAASNYRMVVTDNDEIVVMPKLWLSSHNQTDTYKCMSPLVFNMDGKLLRTLPFEPVHPSGLAYAGGTLYIEAFHDQPSMLYKMH